MREKILNINFIIRRRTKTCINNFIKLHKNNYNTNKLHYIKDIKHKYFIIMYRTQVSINSIVWPILYHISP